jgi:hypothetical protein
LAAQTEIRELVHREGEYSFLLAEPGRERRVRFWGDVPAPATPQVEPALATALLVAMANREALSLPGPVSPQLVRALPDIQAVLRTIGEECSLIENSIEPIEVRPGAATAVDEAQSPDAQRPRGVGAFFSGGVDSWAALLSDPDITDLIYVHGFDIPLEQNAASVSVERLLGATAERLGKRLRVVRTNMRTVVDASIGWEVGHGPGLAAVALMMAPLCERVTIGSTSTYGALTARASHPLHDHLWSTESCRIEHHGAHMTRAEKVELLASHQKALDVLRVCWADVNAYNCGRCEKCIRTMVPLEAAGALEHCPTFAAELDLEAIAELRVSEPDMLVWWRENLEFAQRRGASQSLIDAIAQCIASNEKRFATTQG